MASSTPSPMFAPHGQRLSGGGDQEARLKPVATIGAINDPAMMEEIIASGKADIIYMARELLADPFLPKRLRLARRTRSSVPALFHLHGGAACYRHPALRGESPHRPGDRGHGAHPCAQ
ncbi:MAG: hypothetical protein V8Q30_13415 [Acutalibacteraceae bacterium]